MAPKRVRFAIEEERCEQCPQIGHKLDTTLQRTAAPQQQEPPLDELHACQHKLTAMQTQVDRLTFEVAMEQSSMRQLQLEKRQLEEDVAYLRRELQEERSAKGTKRALDIDNLERLLNQLADCQAELRQSRRHSSGGSHQHQRQHQQQVLGAGVVAHVGAGSGAGDVSVSPGVAPGVNAPAAAGAAGAAGTATLDG